MWDNWVGSRENYREKTQITLKRKVGENSDIGLMKTKIKEVGRSIKWLDKNRFNGTLCCFYYIYVIKRYKYKYIYYYRRENIGSVLHSYRKIELSCASPWKKHSFGCWCYRQARLGGPEAVWYLLDLCAPLSSWAGPVKNKTKPGQSTA